MPGVPATLPVRAAEQIAPDDMALYDRQIRLWGVNAQEKLGRANVLLISAKALANEVAKNLVLAGIKSITLVDHECVSDDDLGAQFLISEDDVGKNRAKSVEPRLQALNRKVSVTVNTTDIREKPVDFYHPFDLVIATDLDYCTLCAINDCTRRAKKRFYAAATHGFFGYIFADLITHDYVIEREKSNVATLLKRESATRSIINIDDKGVENDKRIEMVTKREQYSPLHLVKSSPLPSEYETNLRKRRQVTPLLACLRTLWKFETEQGNDAWNTASNVQLFKATALDIHCSELKLAAKTMTDEFVGQFLRNLDTELAPVTAFIGGQLAQDAINVIGQREQPIQNLMLFDGAATSGPVYAMHPLRNAGR